MPLLVTAAAIAVGLVALAAFAIAGWPGTPVDCGALPCWCEAPSPGLWRQPINTWSNVAPLLAALVMALRRPSPRFTGVAFPLALAFQGLGSMFFHASLVEWAGAVDAASMFAVAGLLLCINLARAGVLAERGVPSASIACVAAGAGLGVGAPGVVAPAIAVMFVALIATEAWAHRRRAGLGAARFRLGLAVFMLGGLAWFGSAFEGMPLCEPASVFQGHALWHATSAAAVYCFWLHVSPTPPSRRGSRPLPQMGARPGSARAGA